MAVACICVFVILPLNLIGTIIGRNWAGHPNFPCRVNAVPRPIPEKKWLVFITSELIRLFIYCVVQALASNTVRGVSIYIVQYDIVFTARWFWYSKELFSQIWWAVKSHQVRLKMFVVQVHGTCSHIGSWWCITFWIHFHWNVSPATPDYVPFFWIWYCI